MEIGAGAGHVTAHILKEMKKFPQVYYTFDVVEMTPSFQPRLQTVLADSPRNVIPQLYMADYLKFSAEFKYDIIISTLPEQTIPSDVNRDLINKMKEDLAPKGTVSRVRYVLRKKWLRKFFKKDTVKDVLATDKMQKEFTNSGETIKKTVWDNVPPVDVFHTTFEEQP